MNYKSAICDDSDADRQYISDLVIKWAANTGHTVQPALFSSAENFMFLYVKLHLKEQGKAVAHVHLGGKEYFESHSFYPKHEYKEYASNMMKKEL